MSSKNQNPYRENSDYNKLFAFIKQKQVINRKQLMEYATTTLGMDAKKASFDITVILSPRAEGTGRGDCRGSVSAQGHVYYMEKLAKIPGEPYSQRFRLRWRNPVLEAHKRNAKEVGHMKVQPEKAEQQTVNETVNEAVSVS